jgi:translocation and assembly module TamA
VGFVDAGDVYKQASDISLASLKVGTGAGLRFSTPVGLFRLDLATPVPRNDRPLRWTFAFGHIF